MVIFKKIRWRNLLSTGQMMTEVQLNRSPSTMITGKNGGGKSTILDSITFALFGKPIRKINKPQLINTKNGRDLLTEIEFSIKDSNWLVRRGMKPDIFEVYKDGQLQNQPGDSRDYQKTLCQILGFDYQTFIQTVIISKTQYTPFMKLDSGKRRQFVETLLNLLVFTNMNRLHQANVSAHKEKVTEVKAAIQVASEKVKIRKKYIADLEAEAQQAEQKSNDQTQARVEALKLECEGVRNEMAADTPPEFDHKAKDDLVKKIDALKELNIKFRVKLDTMENQIRFMEEHSVCNTCGQSITEEHKINQCQTLSKKIQECRVAAESVKQDQARLSSELKVLEKQLSSLKEWENRQAQLKHKIQMLQSQISLLEQEIAQPKTDSGIRQKIQAESVKLIDLQNVYERLLEKQAELAEKTEYYNVVGVMLKDGGIKSMLVRKYITIINQAINSNLAKLGFFAKFTLSENFEETIQARGIDTLSYDNFSEGEKLRIDMAIMLAWREVARMQNGISTNLLILDEVLDASADSFGVDALYQLLSESEGMNLFVVTHSPDKHSDKIRSEIKFAKVDGFSKIVS